MAVAGRGLVSREVRAMQLVAQALTETADVCAALRRALPVVARLVGRRTAGLFLLEEGGAGGPDGSAPGTHRR